MIGSLAETAKTVWQEPKSEGFLGYLRKEGRVRAVKKLQQSKHPPEVQLYAQRARNNGLYLKQCAGSRVLSLAKFALEDWFSKYGPLTSSIWGLTGNVNSVSLPQTY